MLNVEYSLHMTEDIRRHGPLDNYWCFMYERNVKYYKQQTTNMKSMCKTFADRETQLHFARVFLGTNCLPLNTQTFCLSSLKKEPILLKASSVDEAISLKEFIESKSNEIHLAEALGNGILLGAGSFITLTQQQQNDITYWVRKNGVTPLGWCNYCISFKRIVRVTDFVVAIVFRKGENAVLRDSDYVDREWVVEIKSFLVYGPLNGRYFYFVDGVYYVAKSLSSTQIDVDDWTGQPKLIQRDFKRLCIQPLNLLDRKVILHKNQISNATYFLSIDLEKPINLLNPVVPHYPSRGEVVEILLDGATNMVLVESVDDVNQKFNGYRLVKVGGRNPRYKKANFITYCVTFVVCKVEHTVNAGCIYCK